jgi:hypothetical protein
VKRVVDFGLASLVGLMTSSIVAGASYILGVWLGRNSENLREVICFGIPLAALLGLAAATPCIATTVRSYPTPSAVLVGAVLGLLYTILLFRYVARADLGILVQAASCWVAAGICAMLVLAISGRSRRLLAIAGVCLVAIFVPKPVFNMLTHVQQLTVAFIIPSSGREGPAHPNAINFPSDEEARAVGKEAIERVQALGLRRDFRVAYLSRQGRGKQSLAVIVMLGPVEGRAALAEPNGSTIVYVQQGGSWSRYPPDAPTLRRSIEIWSARGRNDAFVYFSIPDATGVTVDGRIVRGPTDPPQEPY